MSEVEYWDSFYASNDWVPKEPTTFANWVREYLNDKSSVVELGCGNGRDSLYFAREGISKILAIDISHSTIDKLNDSVNHLPNVNFKNTDFTKLPPKNELGISTLDIVCTSKKRR
eukprot:TRINITY_DN4352_c0_g1_i2.p1 TRINITY_DN4352_c0_g1~~TRINITY_DN4352_c0_g1_i2.p1  ORF type:complete len:115 (+),score=15.47 TRINITY_DN4352_c0_g1_i2:65-409(+)